MMDTQTLQEGLQQQIEEKEQEIQKNRIEQSTVIFNNKYIEMISNKLDLAQLKYNIEDLPEHKENAKVLVDKLQEKLDWALGFRDTVVTYVNMEVPSITAVKTLGGYELPIQYVQII